MNTAAAAVTGRRPAIHHQARDLPEENLRRNFRVPNYNDDFPVNTRSSLQILSFVTGQLKSANRYREAVQTERHAATVITCSIDISEQVKLESVRILRPGSQATSVSPTLALINDCSRRNKLHLCKRTAAQAGSATRSAGLVVPLRSSNSRAAASLVGTP